MLDSRPYPIASIPATAALESDALHPLRHLLFDGHHALAEMPALSEVIAAAITLALAQRRKAILPVAGEPAELTLVRHQDRVRISYYTTGPAPTVHFLDREVSLRRLLEACARAARQSAREARGTEREALLRMAERATDLTPVTADAPLAPVLCSGGLLEEAAEGMPLGFGFRARLARGASVAQDGHAFADVHALLFEGELWAIARGKRIALAQGPIMLIVQRMVTAVEALVEASRAGRPLNVRLRSGGFSIGLRLQRTCEVSLTLGIPDRPQLTLPALDPESAGLPVLRLASELTRAIIAADRAQARNLRLKELRTQVRRLRHALRGGQRRPSFQNHDPDRLRLTAPENAGDAPRGSSQASTPHRLRFAERWAVEIDGLEAGSTFLCGDRIVLATPTRSLALSRDAGELLWLHPTERSTSVMVGTVLVRMAEDGAVQLCDVRDGHAFAHAQIAPRAGAAPTALFAGGGSLPPLAVVQEQHDRVVALDLRTGETRWRFKARARGPLRLRRSGRVVIVAGNEGSVDAIDAASGEVVWRYADALRFDRGPVICREVVVLLSSGAGRLPAQAVGVDLYTGAPLWTRRFDSDATGEPLAAGATVVVPLADVGRGMLSALRVLDGQPCWQCADPGLGDGGAGMAVDQALVVNAPTGQVSAIALEAGHVLWQRELSNPITDDVPRQLEPVLRNGALFTPAAQVHVLRPSDGTPIATTTACDLVPDLLRVDERGWLYVAEESGHLRGYAPAPHLCLVKG